ncbi:hypothetical protein U1Q18_017785 [Sarracenia purpurea var. burkii]
MVKSPSLGIKPLLGALAGLEDGRVLIYDDKEEGGAVMGAQPEEFIDAQAVDDTSDEAEGEVEISDIMVRMTEHDIGMAVQTFKNIKDSQDAQIRARKGKQVLDNVDVLMPPFVPRVHQMGFGRNGGRGGRFGGRGNRPSFKNVVWKEKSKDDQDKPLVKPYARQVLDNRPKRNWASLLNPLGKGKGMYDTQHSTGATQGSPNDLPSSSHVPGKESQPVEEIRGTVPIENPNQFDCLKGIPDPMEDLQLP